MNFNECTCILQIGAYFGAALAVSDLNKDG